MTTTRKYYELLIETFSNLNAIQQNEIVKLITLKVELINLINRIEKFNLFNLSFSEEFKNILTKDTIENFNEEKIKLCNEIHYELIECLWTTRLRFGGELLPYILKIKIALLNLNTNELKDFENLKKEPEHYFYPEKYIFNSELDKSTKIEKLKRELKEFNIPKREVNLKQKDFLQIENSLEKFHSAYKSYIFSNYPNIAEYFSFYNKKIRAYVTEAMPENVFEFRIHSYEPTNGDNTLKLEQGYYDFYPSYFYNLEEITETLINAIIVSLNKKDLTFTNPFSIKNIHFELFHLYLSNSDENTIVDFAKYLLKIENYKIQEIQEINKYKFDFYGEKNDTKTFFELFHHKSRNIKKLSEEIDRIKALNLLENISFIFTSFPGDETIKLLEENKISFIYLTALTNKHFNLDNSELIIWYIKSQNNQFNLIRNTSEKSFIGDNLIKRLELCELGEKSWPEYEKIGIEIFKFLFQDNFKIYLAEAQIENDLKNHRRDLLVNNNYKDPASFWADVKQKYQATAIIIDFKNYSNKLNSTTFFSVSKYTKKNVGNFAIVFSRRGIDDTAMIEQKTLFENGKLLIAFSDEELKEMIREKIIGKDPIDRLETKKFELVKRS
jgi:hypothetical protein